MFATSIERIRKDNKNFISRVLYRSLLH